jgi:NAD(P)-dependent dehydrogenase (short-subunit alcohol dehydrogenase family)
MSKTILITGSSSGFGALTAELALERGWNVVATARRRGVILPDAGDPDTLVRARLDVTEGGSIRQTVAASVSRFGAIDAVVNNAGIGLVGTGEEVSLAELRRQFETNFFGAVAVTKAVLPIMRQQGSGQLVFISSDLGRTGIPALGAYCAPKFALEGWAESLAPEVAPFGVGVTIVEPGAFETGFHKKSLEHLGAVSDPDSPYAQLYQALKDHFFGGPGRPSGEPVAEAVLKAAEGREPRLRVPVGEDALEWAARRFVPQEETFLGDLAVQFGWGGKRRGGSGEGEEKD